MKNKTIFVIIGIIIVIIIVAVVSSGSNSTPATSASPSQNQPVQTNATVTNNGTVSLADLAKNPSVYSNKTITTTGTIVGIKAITISQDQIKDIDYHAYLVDGSHAIFLVIYQNPSVKKIVTGDSVKITGEFSYNDHSYPPLDSSNTLSNDNITIGSNGSISMVGKSDNIVPVQTVVQKVQSLLALEQKNIASAISTSGSTASVGECMTEYTKVWNKLCSAAGLPNSCMALNYTDSVVSINNSLKNLSRACYVKFHSPADASTFDILLKTYTSASNDDGAQLVSLLQADLQQN